MADETRRSSLKDFNAHADRNGQNNGQESPLDVGVPARTQADLKSDPSGPAETARIASGMPIEGASEATAAETPPENLRRISDASSGLEERPAAKEAIDRATAAVGKRPDDESA